MADSNAQEAKLAIGKKRGLTFKRGVKAPESLIAALEPVRGVKPTDALPTKTYAREMFGTKPSKKNVLKPAVALAKPTGLAKPTVLAKPTGLAKPTVLATATTEEDEGNAIETESIPPEGEEAEAEAEAEAEGPHAEAETLLEMLQQQEAPATISGDASKLPADIEEMGTLIVTEEKRDLYGTTAPTAYVPQTRRGFSDFIKLQYKPYILTDMMKVNKDDKFYKYQEFVRDYMRNAAPYRGILVYHGLGSGKTCTAIAAAEALFATSKKNIIVMSPKSLKKNFLREVSKCGFRHFQLQNFWVKLPNTRDTTVLFFASTVLGISASHLKKAQNIWVPDFRKPQSESNYDTLTPEERQEVRAQILSIVEYDPKTNPTGRIRFISYNGISAKKLMIMACDPSYKKFFDDAVIVVDEIHNLIRTIHGTIEPYIIDIKEGVKGMRKIDPEPITADRWDPAPQMRKNLQRLLSESQEERRARVSRKEKIELYSRGYMFYRLLCDARNSKIIGLSGTPLINHPEELGVLSNVLHGYFTMIEGVIAQTGKAVQEQARALALTHPFTDFVEVKQEPSGGTRLIVSLLPEGIIKVANETGVTRIPTFTETDVYLTMYTAVSALYEGEPVETVRTPAKGTPAKGEPVETVRTPAKGEPVETVRTPAKEEVVGAVRSGYEETDFPPFEDVQRELLDVYAKNPMPTKKQVSDAIIKVYTEAYSSTAMIKSLQKLFKSAGLEISGTPVARAESLLPPIAEDYTTNKRRYKGFHTHFIPDKINLINKGTLVTRLTGLVSYYKGSSLELMPRVERDEVVRVPMSDYVQKSYSEKRVEELKKELDADKEQTVNKAFKLVFDMKDTAQSNNFKMGSRQACNFAFPPEVARPRAGNKKEELAEAMAGMEKEELVTLGEEIPGERDEFPELAEEEGKEEDEEDETAMPVAGEVLEGGAKTLAELRAEAAAKKAAAATTTLSVPGSKAIPSPEIQEDVPSADCKVGRKLGEDMAVAVKRATDCFRDMAIAGKRLLLGAENGLDIYSPKYVAMLERISAAPGSSLVYSTFLNLEGIGLFRIAMTNNGYAPIDMVVSGGQLAFTPDTETSLRLGPGKQPRFLTFSGAEDEQVRAAALSIFNAQFSDLPESMGKILTESGYTDNKVGELCRVFCITSAGAEGLSLRNVRAVHIMEPYWNEVRVRQVKGRAIRIGSHLDLAPEDRNVSIYTYVSVFSDEAQTNTGGERIIETIANHDDVDVQAAKEMGILTDERIKQLSEKLKGKKMTTYVTTTDEFFYSISERKRRVIESIECILKSSAIDCEINYRKNKDSTFMCLPLKGKIGEYVYNPDLEIDILNMPQFSGIDVEKTCTGLDISTALTKPKVVGAKAKAEAEAEAEAVPLPLPLVKDLFKALKGVTYRMRPIIGASGEIERFDMYQADQAQPTKVIPEKLLGMAGVKDGKPAPPVKMLL